MYRVATRDSREADSEVGVAEVAITPGSSPGIGCATQGDHGIGGGEGWCALAAGPRSTTVPGELDVNRASGGGAGDLEFHLDTFDSVSTWDTVVEGGEVRAGTGAVGGVGAIVLVVRVGAVGPGAAVGGGPEEVGCVADRIATGIGIETVTTVLGTAGDNSATLRRSSTNPGARATSPTLVVAGVLDSVNTAEDGVGAVLIGNGDITRLEVNRHEGTTVGGVPVSDDDVVSDAGGADSEVLTEGDAAPAAVEGQGTRGEFSVTGVVEGIVVFITVQADVAEVVGVELAHTREFEFEVGGGGVATLGGESKGEEWFVGFVHEVEGVVDLGGGVVGDGGGTGSYDRADGVEVGGSALVGVFGGDPGSGAGGRSYTNLIYNTIKPIVVTSINGNLILIIAKSSRIT